MTLQDSQAGPPRRGLLDRLLGAGNGFVAISLVALAALLVLVFAPVYPWP